MWYDKDKKYKQGRHKSISFGSLYNNAVSHYTVYNMALDMHTTWQM